MSKRESNSAPPRTRSRGLASFNPEEEDKDEEEKTPKNNNRKTLENNFVKNCDYYNILLKYLLCFYKTI